MIKRMMVASLLFMNVANASENIEAEELEARREILVSSFEGKSLSPRDSYRIRREIVSIEFKQKGISQEEFIAESRAKAIAELSAKSQEKSDKGMCIII